MHSATALGARRAALRVAARARRSMQRRPLLAKSLPCAVGFAFGGEWPGVPGACARCSSAAARGGWARVRARCGCRCRCARLEAGS